ncbi:MAG TPA: hypothetical protein VKG01_02755, partial [Thermoanaerobaculia bacterium]|nr:hypothetical protein [Thermoanaerobaculia bacterium]
MLPGRCAAFLGFAGLLVVAAPAGEAAPKAVPITEALRERLEQLEAMDQAGVPRAEVAARRALP